VPLLEAYQVRRLKIACVPAIGLTNSETAERLGMSEHTAVRHVTNMGMSRGTGNRIKPLASAVTGGLIDPNP
jgi:DNA-binding NarL/FixJ family response regulator